MKINSILALGALIVSSFVTAASASDLWPAGVDPVVEREQHKVAGRIVTRSYLRRALTMFTGRHRSMLAIAAAVVICLAMPFSDASAQQVWFAPNDDLARGPNRDRYLNHDFPRLFDPSPAWSATTDVFKISPMMGSTVGPEDELRRINAFLTGRRIALAVDTGAVTTDNPGPVPGECGFGVEGFIGPGRNAGPSSG
jgi:type IV secretory pathway VirB2 component (pilin)